MLERAESKDGYRFDIEKFRKDSRRPSEDGDLLGLKESEIIEGMKHDKIGGLGMIRILEEKSVDAEDQRASA